MARRYPSKHKTFVELLHNVGTTSKTLDRRCLDVIQMFCGYFLLCRGNKHNTTTKIFSVKSVDAGQTLSHLWADIRC